MADVEISYNNSVIASLSDSGTEVLETNGKFLADDITITYTKSGGENVASNIVYVDYTYTETSSAQTWTLGKTNQELIDLLDAGNVVFVKKQDDTYVRLVGVQKRSTTYKLTFIPSYFTYSSDYSYVPLRYMDYVSSSLSAYPGITVNQGGSND